MKNNYVLSLGDKELNGYFFLDINMGTFYISEIINDFIDIDDIKFYIKKDNEIIINNLGILKRISIYDKYIYVICFKEIDNIEFYTFDNLAEGITNSCDEILDILSHICELPSGNYMIGNVQDYITIVEKITNNFSEEELFFRGHYSYKYTLKPSLFRKKKYSENENFMYMDFKTQFYKELSNKKYIEILTTMQHFKMPTRLLDTTSNPLVALYMACDKPNNYKKSNVNFGEVLIMHEKRKNVKYSDSNSVVLLSSLAVLETNYKQEMYEKIIESIEKNDPSIYKNSSAFKRFVAEVKNELPSFDYDFFKPQVLLNPCHVKVGMINERIIAQSGNFILFGLCDYQTGKYNKLNTLHDKRIFIVNRSKILKQLSMLNINESTMYPDKDHMSMIITKTYD